MTSWNVCDFKKALWVCKCEVEDNFKARISRRWDGCLGRGQEEQGREGGGLCPKHKLASQCRRVNLEAQRDCSRHRGFSARGFRWRSSLFHFSDASAFEKSASSLLARRFECDQVRRNTSAAVTTRRRWLKIELTKQRSVLSILRSFHNVCTWVWIPQTNRSLLPSSGHSHSSRTFWRILKLESKCSLKVWMSFFQWLFFHAARQCELIPLSKRLLNWNFEF